MSLSRRHYNEIATIISNTMLSVASNPRATAQGSVMLVAEKLCLFFKQENPAFNKDVFRNACGYDCMEPEQKCSACRVGMALVNGYHVTKSGARVSRCANIK